MSVSEGSDGGDVTGWAAVPNWIVRDPKIDQSVKIVYLLLSSYAGARGVCWPSQTTLAEAAGTSTRTVKRAVSELRSMGLVRVTVKRTPHGRANVYFLRIHPWDGDTGGPTHGDMRDPGRRTS